MHMHINPHMHKRTYTHKCTHTYTHTHTAKIHVEPTKSRDFGSTMQAIVSVCTKTGGYDRVCDVLREIRKVVRGWNTVCEGRESGRRQVVL